MKTTIISFASGITAVKRIPFKLWDFYELLDCSLWISTSHSLRPTAQHSSLAGDIFVPLEEMAMIPGQKLLLMESLVVFRMKRGKSQDH